uniref:Pre-mRNA splicing Prp18-interacting factor n=1 Tax=Tanacetum cinerariifolium TaxID=118510 RepID=A0A699JRS3_TANCI|nr:hypothetical protein [Tanacetum cinerariifolium]
MSSFFEFTCYGCGGPSDTPLCYLCTCEQCGNILIDGTCSKCNSGAGNSFVYDPNPKSFNEVQIIFNPPPQPHYNIYLCQLCESNSHYGYKCSQRVSLVYKPEPCYNKSFGDNAYPHDSPENEHAQLFSAIAITLDLPTVEPEDSLRMGDEHLDTIPEMESDEFIKSSVENLIPNPSEFEDERYDNESFSDEDIPKEIYSNPLFDEKIIYIKIDPRHFNAESDLIESLRNQDSSIISSSKIDFLLDEFAGELIFLKSIPPGIGEADCDPEEEIRLIGKLLYDNSSPRPLEEFISKIFDAAIKSFSPFPIPVEDSDSLRDEINLSLTLDDSMPPGIENDDYDSEGDMLILEEFFSNDSLSLPENESFHFDIPSSPRPPTKPPDDDEIEPGSRILTVKIVGDIFEHYVSIPILFPPNPPLLQIRRNLLISYHIRALKLFSFRLKAR